MKKYLKLLPVILYPYAYIIGFVLLYLGILIFDDTISSQTSVDIFSYSILGYHILALISAVYGAVLAGGNRYTAKEVIKMNFCIKSVQIPGYILLFIIGIIGLLMGIWGIGLFFFAVIVDVIAIALTGIFSIGCMIKLKREHMISIPVMIFAGIGSFIFCVDVVIAFLFMLKDNKVGSREM